MHNPGAPHENVNKINPAARSIINRRLNAALRRKISDLGRSNDMTGRLGDDAPSITVYLSHRTQ